MPRRPPCATSSPSSRRSGCSTTRTPRPAVSPPTRATGCTPRSCSSSTRASVEPLPVDLSTVRSEVDTALRTTTEMLSQVTSLVALVTAPPLETTEIRHIEVLLLQPQVVMVVVITSTGGVTKKIVPFETAVDPKLAEWARAFLNEQLTGVRLGGRMLQNRLDEPGLSPRESAFLAALRPAFTELVWEGQQGLYVGGAARLLDEMRFADLDQINDLVRVLESRVGMLGMLREALESPRPYLRIGSDHTVPLHARPGDGGGQLRPGHAEPGHGVADRPDADGLRGRDPLGARRRPRCRSGSPTSTRMSGQAFPPSGRSSARSANAATDRPRPRDQLAGGRDPAATRRGRRGRSTPRSPRRCRRRRRAADDVEQAVRVRSSPPRPRAGSRPARRRAGLRDDPPCMPIETPPAIIAPDHESRGGEGLQSSPPRL